ncbi:IS200/IS605 family transposase [Phenylobacterium sp.]|uniref:IS200/IS605 family transposase n=1 Tax=Phenylobacterium sp. TaxID=1871053 RepID=UPI002F3F3682
MEADNEYRQGRHCVFALHAHLVFVAKYRRRVFTATILDDMRPIFAKVCADFEAELVEFDGEDDHVHLLVHYPPKVSLSSLVNSLKGVSSRRLRRMHPPLVRRYWNGVLWSPSYFAASCGGAPLAIIRQYIEQQRTPD